MTDQGLKDENLTNRGLEDESCADQGLESGTLVHVAQEIEVGRLAELQELFFWSSGDELAKPGGAAHSHSSWLPVSSLPSVVISKILSYLTWNEKLDAVAAIPVWKLHLQSVGAWPALVYEKEAEANIYFVRDMRTRLLVCLKRYGRHMKCININFVHKIGRLGEQILLAIADNCKSLQTFRAGQKCSLSTWECNYTWSRNAVRNFCAILQQCSKLNDLCLARPIIDWALPPSTNIIMNVMQGNLESTITELEMDSNSLMEHDGYLDILCSFARLKRLVVRRDKINDEILMNLISNNLRELTLFQDEELHAKDMPQFGSEFWRQVRQVCPEFRMDLVLRFIMIIKDSFPQHMPLRCLVLDDLVNIITKGVLDSITENYSGTLELFSYTNSYIETFETGDRRLPSALVTLTTKCTRLHSVRYGFPLSSTTVLQIAKARKLKTFLVPAVELSYEFDWPILPEWTTDFVEWLKENGKSESLLEKAVSELFGFDWTLCPSINDQFLEPSFDHMQL